MEITIGSLFDGIGGFPLAGQRNGMTALWASEIEPFPIKVTKIRFPDMKHLGDITQINGAEIEPVDIVTGGSPCQDLSVAGKRAGLAGERSGLFMEMIRIIEEMLVATNREYPKAIVWENVPGAFSSNKGEDIRCVLDEFERLGFIVDLNVLDAQYMGVPQRRRRIYSACLNVDHIRKMKTNTSWSIITQLLIEILLCILNEALNLYEKEPKGSVWRQRKLTADGLQRKMKLFSIEARKDFEKLLTDWAGICQIHLKEQSYLVDPSEKSDITIKTDTFKNEFLMGMEPEELFGSILKSWKELLDVLYDQENSCITLTVTNETMNQIIYGCATLLENTALLIAQLKNSCQNSYETAFYILTGRKVCINYARERQTSCPLFEGLEWFYRWNDYIDICSKNGEQFERYFRTESAPEILFKRQGLSRHSQESGEARERIATDAERSINQAIAIDSNCQDSRFKLTGGVVPTIPAKAGTGGNNGPMLAVPDKSYCLQGSMIGRADKNGPQGNGINEDVSLYSFQRSDAFKETDKASTQSRRQYKDATDLVCSVDCRNFNETDKHGTLQAKGNGGQSLNYMGAVREGYSVRRLTPLECERLQGFPDGWTDIPGQTEATQEELEFWRDVWLTWDKTRAEDPDKVKPRTDKAILKWLKNPVSDSAQYKALGNSVAVPCPEYVLEGIKEVLEVAHEK